MTRTPAPADVAADATRAATTLRTHGPRLLTQAELLAARGWPAGGEGGAPDDVHLTTVEAAVNRPNPHAGLDDDYRNALTALWHALGHFHTVTARILNHADPASADRPNKQPGSGACLACTRHVPGTAVDRLRAGFCDACRKRWERQGRPDRAAFIRSVQQELVP